MNTINEACWSKQDQNWHVYEAGKREKKKSLSSRSNHHFSKEEEETLLWTMNFHKLCIQGSVLLYEHCSYPCQIHVPPVQQNTCAANFMRHSQIHVCLQELFQSYTDVTALSSSLCIQEWMLRCPGDVFLCPCQGKKKVKLSRSGVLKNHLTIRTCWDFI